MKYSLRSLMIAVTVLPVFRESRRGTFGYGHVNLPIRRDQSKNKKRLVRKRVPKGTPLFFTTDCRYPRIDNVGRRESE